MLPLSLIWWGGSFCFRKILLWNSRHESVPNLSLVVVGSVRIGGGGKTPVAAELARQLSSQGLRVGVLAHSVECSIPETIRMVNPDSDWRFSSEEALWLAQFTRLPVWVTRNRWKAWKMLAQKDLLDILVSDDGWEDPRLPSHRRILLDWGDPCEHWWNLYPVGRCRSLRQNQPHAEVWTVSGLKGNGRVRMGISSVQNSLGENLQSKAWAICGIGDPKRFEMDLREYGVVLQGMTALKDHSHHVSREIRRLLALGQPAVVLTRKDWMRLETDLAQNPNVFVAEQAIRLG